MADVSRKRPADGRTKGGKIGKGMAKGFRMIRCGMRGVEAVAAETRHSFPRHSHQHYGIGVIHR
ncbi:hypothetical protein AB4144_42110, partial [Rhizobiaceae sp. 2RAB30]